MSQRTIPNNIRRTIVLSDAVECRCIGCNKDFASFINTSYRIYCPDCAFQFQLKYVLSWDESITGLSNDLVHQLDCFGG